MSDKVTLACMIAFVLSICAMCGAFICIDAGVVDGNNVWAQLAYTSPTIVFALSLWAIEIAEQIERKKAQQ